jgi:hypothetical protein
VFAVPKGLLGPDPDASLRAEWVGEQKRNGALKLGELSFRVDLPLYDRRDPVEVTYRIEIGSEGGRLVKVSENAGNPWVKGAMVAVPVLFGLAAIRLGLRASRRARNRPPEADHSTGERHGRS